MIMLAVAVCDSVAVLVRVRVAGMSQLAVAVAVSTPSGEAEAEVRGDTVVVSVEIFSKLSVRVFSGGTVRVKVSNASVVVLETFRDAVGLAEAIRRVEEGVINRLVVFVLPIEEVPEAVMGTSLERL